MYTLQILDDGQTFLHTLGEEPAALGSSEGSDLRLREDGVQAKHVELVPAPGRVQLIAHGEVSINGKQVERADLQLGDRIEIGRAVLVVGRTVARPAEPEDVLAGSVSRGTRRARKSSSKVVPILIATLVMVGVVVFAMQRGGDGHVVRARLADVESYRAKGQLDRARQEVAVLRREWADAQDDRLQRLKQVEEAVDAVEQSRAALLARIADPADTRSYQEWRKELMELERSGQPGDRVAARFVRSRLKETLLARDEEIARLATGRNRAAAGAPDENGKAAPTDGAVASQAATGPAFDPSDVDRLVREGMFAQALSLIQAAYAQADAGAGVQQLRNREAEVRAQAKQQLDKLFSEVRASAKAGQVEQALATLQSNRHRFPPAIAFQSLEGELRSMRVASAEPAQPAATPDQPTPGQPEKVDAATRLATLAALRGQIDAVRDAEESGQYARADRLLREAADAVQARDAEFADRLRLRADEAGLLAGWHEHVVAIVQAGRSLATVDATGSPLTLLRVDGAQLIARTAKGDASFAWYELDGAGVRKLVQATRAKGQAALGAAALLYKQGETAAAESVLADALRKDSKLLADVNGVIARGRGEQIGDYGYVLKKGVFVSEREIEIEKLAGPMATKLAAALRDKDDSAREQLIVSTVAAGGMQTDVLAFAMREAFVELRDKIDRSPLRKQVDKMTELRADLDEARQHAKALIFDTVKYFYPYKPPAVSGEKHAEYNRVQAEINERVAAVRDIWQNSKTRIRVTDRFGEDLERLDWLAATMAKIGAMPTGESTVRMLQPMEWARALQTGTTITLQTFCLTPSERDELTHWQRVVAYNARLGNELSNAQRQLLRITNEYRQMFRHRPLAAVLTCMTAAQGHADEMSKLGYFSHTSPTPALRTPYDRMRRAGYMFGVSENIALTGGAQAAHNAWCTSSGHHRNLLEASHHEVGLGANGRYWVQNFGSGEVYKQHPAWAKAD